MISVVVIQAELLGKQERESEVDSFALPKKAGSSGTNKKIKALTPGLCSR